MENEIPKLIRAIESLTTGVSANAKGVASLSEGLNATTANVMALQVLVMALLRQAAAQPEQLEALAVTIAELAENREVRLLFGSRSETVLQSFPAALLAATPAPLQQRVAQLMRPQ
jgi:hypothetical protein